jgi:hypothetical protein
LSPSLPADFIPFSLVTLPEEAYEVQPPLFHRNSLLVMENTFGGSKNTYHRIPEWNISGRPANPRVGTIGFNLQMICLEYWDGTSWLRLPMKKIDIF